MQRSGENLDESGFAGPVVADQCVHLASTQCEVDATQCANMGEGLGDSRSHQDVIVLLGHDVTPWWGCSTRLSVTGVSVRQRRGVGERASVGLLRALVPNPRLSDKWGQDLRQHSDH